MKSKLIGDGPSGIVKPPTKVAKTYDILRSTLGYTPEAIGSGSPKPTKVPISQKKPYGKSPIVEAFFTYN